MRMKVVVSRETPCFVGLTRGWGVFWPGFHWIGPRARRQAAPAARPMSCGGAQFARLWLCHGKKRSGLWPGIFSPHNGHCGGGASCVGTGFRLWCGTARTVTSPFGLAQRFTGRSTAGPICGGRAGSDVPVVRQRSTKVRPVSACHIRPPERQFGSENEGLRGRTKACEGLRGRAPIRGTPAHLNPAR